MRFALALVLAGVVAVVATAAYGHGSARGVPHGFRPETAAAVGTRDLWVLGDYRCGSSWCLALVRSTDGGRHFVRVAVPPFPSQGAVPRVEFANARVGYSIVGGRLYVTRDGGTSWRRGGLGHVMDIAVAGGHVYALVRSRHFERSPVSKSSWHDVPLPARIRLVSLAARGRRVWLLGSTRRIRAGDVTLRSADRGTDVRQESRTCIPELAGRLVPAGRGVVWAVCPSGMMAGLSLSTNGGRTFPRYRSFHDPGGIRLPVLTNGAQLVPASPRVAVLYAGVQGPLYRTTDLGRRWTRVPRTGHFGQLFWLGFTTRRVGVAVVQEGHDGKFLRTTDGGASWHSLAVA